ncbi:MAG: SpoIIE family protein phosphatase [Syntrophales bacterium]|nr:SpoIIE family protein phosphatase [Syntrophales bacterium]
MKHLKGKVIVGICLIYGVVGALTVAAFYLGIQRIIALFGTKYAVNQALLEKNKVLSVIDREVALALKLADDPLIRRWCKEENNRALKQQAMAHLESYRKTFRSQSFFIALRTSGHYYVYDREKKAIGMTTLDRHNPADRWFFHTLQEVDTFGLNVDYNALLNVAKVWINAVLKDTGGQRIAVVGTGIDLSDFFQEIMAARTEGVMTILVDERGIIQAHPNRRYVEHNARSLSEDAKIHIFNLLTDAGQREQLMTAMANLAAAKDHVQTLELAMEGRTYLAAVAFLPGFRWYDIVLLDVGQVVEMRDFLPMAVVVALSLLSTLVIVTILLDRIVLQPLSVLTAAADQVSRGRYDVFLPETRTDEIGHLTASFNHMAATVREYTQELENKVQERTTALSEANAALKQSRDQIIESIQSARVIQSSILPDESFLAARLKEYFLIYAPRDVVGGDFYYAKDLPDGSYLTAVIDCTGHGVPGAFMTMTVNAILNHIVDAVCADDPARILGELHRLMKATMHHDIAAYQLASGLDIGLCLCRPQEGSLVFAGAGIPLYVYEAGKVREIEGNRKRIGHKDRGKPYVYDQHVLTVQAETTFYLATDGVLDLAGGSRGFGLGRERLRDMIAAHATLRLTEQGKIYRQLLDAYRGELPLRDDMVFWGFKIL